MTAPRADVTTPLMSPTLGINQQIRAMQARGSEVVHLGFGEAGLPAPRELVDALAAHAGDNSYGHIRGSEELRESVAGYFTRRGLVTGSQQIMVGPGSKALLYGVVTALDGDVVLPRPSWVSYAPQVLLNGRNPIWVPIPSEFGGVPDLEQLERRLHQARLEGQEPKAMIVTQPDNPTGTVATRSMLEQLANLARAYDLWIISDEIYRDLTYQPEHFVSVAEVAPERTVLTTGLSKSLALGGWRIGVMRVPDEARGRQILESVSGIASEVWSCVSAPVAAAAVLAFDEPPAITATIANARQLHARVSAAVFEIFDNAHVPCRRPQAGFYMYPDLKCAETYLGSLGVTNDQDLADYLLNEHRVAVLPGSAFGDDPRNLRFRVATSLLYGTTNSLREQALAWAASTVQDLPPHIAEPVSQIRVAIESIMSNVSR